VPNYERVFAWDFDGGLLPGYPLYASAAATALSGNPHSPVIADTDKDGKLNVILSTHGSKLICWEFDVDFSAARAPWPQYKHDKWNSGRHGFIIDPRVGDANGDEQINVADAVYLINYIFRGGPAPYPLDLGDANCDGDVNVGDAVYLIAYVFSGGPEPGCP
jgi:hypothetical protein